jgi:mono/diheme cytochrome c family protein
VDQYLMWAIADGGAPFATSMPAFKDGLSDRKIWQIVAYMRSGFPTIDRGERQNEDAHAPQA